MAEESAKTEAMCEHLVVSFSDASEEIEGVAAGCASVESVLSSPKRAACVLSGDADMPGKPGSKQMPQYSEHWRKWGALQFWY